MTPMPPWIAEQLVRDRQRAFEAAAARARQRRELPRRRHRLWHIGIVLRRLRGTRPGLPPTASNEGHLDAEPDQVVVDLRDISGSEGAPAMRDRVDVDRACLGAAAVVRNHLAKVDRGFRAELADAYAPDAVVDQPMMPGEPHRLEGRDAIRDHFAAAGSLPIRLRVRKLIVHATSDPRIVVAEYDYEISTATTEASFTASNIQVFRVEGEYIVASRDYHDHQRIGQALRNANA
jgi:ketosteroid isomerase-like protein